MSIDRAKALQSAQKYLARGQLDRAIGEYERLVEADPKDARMLLKLGDLYTRQGANKDASATYRKVAEQYAEQGFFLKAVAVCKQILKLDPSQLEVWERLAEMYEMLSLVSDAIGTYEQIADAHGRANNPRKAVRALEKIAELDPENVAARIRYAEALSKLNRPEEAAAAFRAGADLLKAQGRYDDYLKVGERLLFHRPDDYDVARELAGLYLDRGDAKHSLAKLQACFNADPKNLETLLLLARAFEQLGQTQKTISVLKEVARLHALDARRAEQGSVLRRIIALDPSDGEARRELSQLGPLPREESSVAIDVSDEDYDMVLEDELVEADTRKSGSNARAFPDAEETQAKLKRLLDECAVFVRYGLTDKIITQLSEVLELAPEHTDAREKLKDAYLKARRPNDAIQQLLILAEQAKRDRGRSEQYLKQALAIDPRHALARERLGKLMAQPTAADDDDLIIVEDPAPAPLASSGERPEESFASVMPGTEVDDEPEFVLEDTGVDAIEEAAGLRARGPAEDGELEDESVVIEDDDSGFEYAEEEEESVLVVEDSTVEPLPAAARGPQGPRTDPAPPPDSELEQPEPSEELPEALTEALEEIEFYLKQGLSDEARATLDDALESFPDHPLLLAHQRRLSQPSGLPQPTAAKPAAKAAPAPAPLEDRSFELAQKLAQEVKAPAASGAGPVDVADVLAQFKQGVAKQVDKKDSATHYDLGIAYMEMGLHAEAIEEFKLCLDDEQRRCTAHTMIGLSYVAKGDMEPGVEHFQLALTSNPTLEEELSLWFEMGNAHELWGKNMEALVWYEKVEERDSSFRDVMQRIERLGVARTPEQEADEFDEMFDNMILKE